MKSLLSIIIIFLVLMGCNNAHEAKRLSSEGKNAESVYLTHDQNNNPVVAWTEKEDEQLNFVFAISQDDGKSFSKNIILPLSADVATHAESMPKIAFKKDGTIMIAYEKKAPTKDNKYAGAIFYITSADNGSTWSTEKYLHSDTVAGRSHSYFDIETMPDGEIGASWLDLKLDNETGGRSVLFARTNASNQFTNEMLIDSSACQCCRIDVYTDISKNVFIAYRGLKKGEMGKQIRDMKVCSSVDQGKSFSQPVIISNDNWNIDGCPHTGPALCSNKAGLFTMWYTEGNGNGIYYTHKSENGDEFNPRQLISRVGHHPQVSASGGRIAMIWEENVDNNGKPITSVHYRLIENGADVEKKVISPEKLNAFVPVVISTRNGFLAAFLVEENGKVVMYVKSL